MFYPSDYAEYRDENGNLKYKMIENKLVELANSHKDEYTLDEVLSIILIYCHHKSDELIVLIQFLKEALDSINS